MIEISLCMIVKNEEKILARCLDSVADLVDEIVIVDTGSTDATKKLQRIIQIKSTILRGWMIFRRREILLFRRRKKTIFIQRMRMR